jgi:hypothetical protein
MFDVAAVDESDGEWVKTEMNDQWMGMTDDEAESSKSEDDVVVEDESVVDGPANSNADFLRVDPVQVDLRTRIVNQRASLKKRVEHMEEMRQKLQRCSNTTWSAQFCSMCCVCYNIQSEHLSLSKSPC